jgi:hypothetical protein
MVVYDLGLVGVFFSPGTDMEMGLFLLLEKVFTEVGVQHSIPCCISPIASSF